jgi:ADP-ribose pyrophosphatase YjhB (NUDIX family)
MTETCDLQNGHDARLYVSLAATPGSRSAIPIDHPPYRYCPACGGNLETRLLRAGEPERLVCTACGFVFYLDPKVAVGTIIQMRDERIVLVRRAIEPGYGQWVFPGGYVDRGEPLAAAAIREAKEEAGLEIELNGLVNVYSYRGRAPVIIVYAATALRGEPTADEESLEVALFSPDELPWDKLAFRSTREALRDYLRGVLHPHLTDPGSGTEHPVPPSR